VNGVSRVESVQVTSEPAHHAETMSSPEPTAVEWQRRPGEGELDRDNLGTGLITEVDELAEELASALESEAELAACHQVVVE
jgi:hypothetical protein